MLDEGLNKIREYFRGIDIYNGAWVVRVSYPQKWGAYPPEDGSIKVVSDENEAGLWWYCANNEGVTVDKIINLIEETVHTNMEAIKKVELFKLKASELKQLFSDESISFKRLQTLKFVFDSSPINEEKVVKKGEAKKVASKKDLINQVDDAIKEHDVFTAKPEKVEEVLSKREVPKKTTRKKPVVEQEVVSTSTPDEMTQAEIDDLRG